MKTKKFVTLYYKGVYNAYLIKDIGQIPYYMHKKFGYDAVLLGPRGDAEYPLLEETQGLKLEFVPKGKKIWKLFEIPTVKYLFKHSREIDVLNIYFAKGISLVYGLIYKWRNPNGVLYIKLDADLDLIKKAESCFYPTRNFLKKLLYSCLVPVFFKKVDLFSIEQKEGMTLIEKFHPQYAHKFICLPNGVSEQFFLASSERKPYEQKENIILTVGRIGTYVKYNELLLDAVRKIDLKTWKVVLVGPIQEEFNRYIEEYFRQNPELKEKVVFTGPVFEREKLLAWFDRAKLFCYTSSGESFGIVLAEAMLYGNYIVTTDISSANDITDNGRLGRVIPRFNTDRLADALQALIDDENLPRTLYTPIREYAAQTFNWERIIDTLQQNIEPKLSK